MGLAKSSAPIGFRENTDGLLVPGDLPRLREVITSEEWKYVRLAIEHVCAPRNLRFVWMCNDAHCSDKIMKRLRTADGFKLQCAHRELVVSKDI